MKSNKKKINSTKSSSQFDNKLKEAKVSYNKIFTEVAPFIPKVQVKEVTTEGKWQTTASFSLY